MMTDDMTRRGADDGLFAVATIAGALGVPLSLDQMRALWWGGPLTR